MTPIAGQPILTAAEMRAAEERAIAAGASVEALMDRAGKGVAAAVQRLASDAPVLVLCGPGNNGGDGYVAATALAAAGLDVRVAATGEPSSAAARKAKAGWSGPIEDIASTKAAPVLVDALFGTGLSRPLNPALEKKLVDLAVKSRLVIAVDLPSGVTTDEGRALGAVPDFDVTLALGALKPAHLLQPAARYCGAVRMIDIGIDANSETQVIDKPSLETPGPDVHKYTRGMVAIIAGAMPGATLLASEAAMRAGAGYVALLGSGQGGPHALVHKPLDDDSLTDSRTGALLIGPGLGRDADAAAKLDRALATDHPLVIDGDALHLLKDRLETLAKRHSPAILTPHAGEFDALFGKDDTSKLARARAAARRANATIVFKGADTVIAAPDGRARLTPDASDWLSTAGTGDVLAGVIAAMLAARLDPLDAASAGVWLHGDAARRLGPAFIADDLARAMTAARASL
ncbi:NAD(P)H-hydrate dehydratase [Sphingomonas koreensis]|nr:NAD(P)H-hydrate dehydratase [Sphingomonas koreensis]